ncbi:MAG: trypsin-like peptidase domain-containing protein [Clostridia bacterium]|nr:trypsin-like peptidase domain-containing protein [Clostridia bacterium]
MFADAIERVGNFTRPIKFISRNYKDSTVVPGLATLFFINEDGYAITCRHVVEQLAAADNINQNYFNFKSECLQIPNDNKRRSAIKKIEQKYNIKPNQTVQLKIQLPDCVDTFNQLDFIIHPNYDIAIIHFIGFKNVVYNGHAVFAKDDNSIRPGDMLCRLGFPFPEFTDFNYDAVNDDIDWSSNGTANTPRFPIDGMFTRHLADENGNVIGIELSTPGLRGQSGGPLFTSNGLIYGIQSMTNHLHLGFDMIKARMVINGKQETINNQPFLHVGQCVHVSLIKKFLDDNKIKYYVGNTLNDIEAING